MAKENRDKALGNSNKKDNQIISQTVAEGSTVILDAHDFIKDVDIDTIKSYSWKQKTNDSGTPVVNLANENTQNLLFTAPYVRGHEVNTTLNFELMTTDNNGKMITHNASTVVKLVQRAIIFQGGVALGAYEAGVFQAIVEMLVKINEDKKRKGLENEKRPLFDIVAGTSIGAMNSAIIVSSVTKKGKSLEDAETWKDSAEEVIEFWRAQQQWPTVADGLDMNPLYHYGWDLLHHSSKAFKHSVTELMEFYSNMNTEVKEWYDVLANWTLVHPSFLKDSIINGWNIPATAEAARRYYSAKQFLRTVGPFNVATGIWPWLRFGKFFDIFEQTNYMPRPDNKHYVLFSLKRTLERFARFPIKTREGEPRLLLVSVDVKTGDAVTFDSYLEQTKYHDGRNSISTQNGIVIEHALASGAFPDFFDYPKFEVQDAEMSMKNEHIFWDGGFRSNTPLREVMQAHRDYWLFMAREKHKGDKDYEYENDVPDLEIYVADLWPSELKEDPISFDRDFVENRKWNLLLGDKTDYDEQVANVVTDYIDLARRLKSLAVLKGASKDEINHILNSHASSINTKGKTRIYRDLLVGRFSLTKVVRIDHKDDGNEVHDKVFDYSSKTIEQLMINGHRDTLIQMSMQAMKDEFVKLERKFVKLDGKSEIEKKEIEKDMEKLEQLEQEFQQIQQSIRIENSHKTTSIANRVEELIRILRSMPDELKGNNNHDLPIKEETTLVINAAKEFRETITSAEIQQKMLS